ncbi:hypothetical protein FACS1894190_11330 [Spirochaetia bacterium]|nr:hypothetical protein FACS1894190_11330 [Spirochaetia bacterium]
MKYIAEQIVSFSKNKSLYLNSLLSEATHSFRIARNIITQYNLIINNGLWKNINTANANMATRVNLNACG